MYLEAVITNKGLQQRRRRRKSEPSYLLPASFVPPLFLLRNHQHTPNLSQWFIFYFLFFYTFPLFFINHIHSLDTLYPGSSYFSSIFGVFNLYLSFRWQKAILFLFMISACVLTLTMNHEDSFQGSINKDTLRTVLMTLAAICYWRRQRMKNEQLQLLVLNDERKGPKDRKN